MMEDEAVVRRQWVTRQRFLDLLGAANLLPGASSSEMAIYLGYVRAGWLGLVLGGVCFIVPAALLVAALAWTYTRFGSLPEMAGVLYGIRPVVVAIIVQAVWRLGRAAVTDVTSVVVGVVAAALSIDGVAPVVVLLVSGITIALARGLPALRRGSDAALLPISPVVAAGALRNGEPVAVPVIEAVAVGLLRASSGISAVRR
jgi:chromate transporter